MKAHLHRRFFLAGYIAFLLTYSSQSSYAANTIIVHGRVVVVSKEKGAKKETETPCDKGPVAAYLNKKHDGRKQGTDTTDSQGQYYNLKADYVGDTIDVWVMMDPIQNDLYADPVEVNPGSPDKRTEPTIVGAKDLMAKRQKTAVAENNLIEGAWFAAAVIETQGVLAYLNVVHPVRAEQTATDLVYTVEDAQNAKKEGENRSRFLAEVNTRLNAFTEAHPAVKDDVNYLAKSAGVLAHRVTHRTFFAKE